MSTNYHIRIRGHLHDRWAGWFEDFSIERQDDGTTLLTGSVIDQAALHGVLARIRDLGIPLVTVTQVGTERDPSEGGSANDSTH